MIGNPDRNFRRETAPTWAQIFGFALVVFVLSALLGWLLMVLI